MADSPHDAHADSHPPHDDRTPVRGSHPVPRIPPSLFLPPAPGPRAFLTAAPARAVEPRPHLPVPVIPAPALPPRPIQSPAPLVRLTVDTIESPVVTASGPGGGPTGKPAGAESERGGLDLVPALVAVGLLAAVAIGLLPFVTAPKPSDAPPASDSPIAIVGTQSLAPTTMAAEPSYPPVDSARAPSLSTRAPQPSPTPSASPTTRPAVESAAASPSATREEAPPTTRPPVSTSPRPSATTRPPASSKPELAALSPLRERSLRSVDGGQVTYVEFVNRRHQPVRIFWLDHGGNRRYYETIEPGQTHRQHTFVGHPWLVTNRHGWGLVCFEPGRTTSVAIIR